jgi:hypothetical protein
VENSFMSIIRKARIAVKVGALVAVPVLTATAQAQSPPSPTGPPAATKPEAGMPPAQPQATQPTAPAEKKAAAPAADIGKLVGLSAKSSDGHNLGTVQSVKRTDGKPGIGVKVGGFLGIGSHLVEIPDGKFNRVGDTVQVNMTADEISKLPKATQK